MRGGAERARGQVLDLEVSIEPGEVRRWLGYPSGRRPPPRIEGLLVRVLAEARLLARPRGAFALLDPGEAPGLGLGSVAAEALLVGLVTAGPRLEARVAELLERGEPTAALLLDAAGTAAVEEAADRLAALALAGEAGAARPRVPCRMSPGYGPWPIERQRELLERLPAREAGVRLLPSLVMAPRKSVSFAIWLGAGGRPGEPASGCARCGLDRCRYRVAPSGAEREGSS